MLLLAGNCIYSQSKDEISDLISVEKNNSLRIYISEVYQISYKEKHSYYLIANFDKNNFQFKDTVCVFYKNGNLREVVTYNDGLRHGNFISYFKNGIKRCEGQFSKGKRVGVWIYYTSNGIDYKHIRYDKGIPKLWKYKDERGKETVIDGNGTFKENLCLSILSNTKHEVNGKVKNGLLTGIVKTSVKGIKVATEEFVNGKLVKGISHSKVFGDSDYSDKYLGSFESIEYIEHIRITGPESMPSKNNLGLSKPFTNRLNSALKQGEFQNCWFFIELKLSNKRMIEEVKMISNSNIELSNSVNEIIFGLKRVEPDIFKLPQAAPKTLYFPLVIKNNSIYIKDKHVMKL